ncbi:alpha/beta hydrolase-fold protein [Flavobacterium sp.]|uniref:alpha/beta hydrolase n=1 Tax=Flavobacterium sp. TaxID=239 RepID=UPI00286BB2EB|nr:alpha/beta hydrolase-fold protein [Flavobacterium sp.]
MRKSLLILLMTIPLAYAQDVKVTSGKVIRFANFKSQFVDARNVDVWLPDGYSEKQKYAVLYMHDGQMLFDPETTWNKQAWEVDRIAGKLMAENKTQKFIVVGIWNNNKKRHPEYFPQKPFETLDATQRKMVSDVLNKEHKIDIEFNPISDAYLKFLVTELKPFIDSHFSTSKKGEQTFISGSSMGGLISLYAICEYPKVFGGAACLSTHWTGIYRNNDNPIPDAFMAYLKTKLPNPKNHKIYFDYGDQTLDSLYDPSQKRANQIMMDKGFSSKNWMTKFFPGKDHSEAAWRERLDIPLQFLLER